MVRGMAERQDTVVRVMIVEDDLGNLERFAEALVRDPRTRVAEKVRCGRDAIARLPDVSPDVLLVDLGLPDIHGTEVIRFAARTLPECDVMVITVFGDERNVIASIEAGATGYVLKDCSDADLVARVLELRAGGSPMSPGIARIVLNQMRSGPRGASAARRTRNQRGRGRSVAVDHPRDRGSAPAVARLLLLRSRRQARHLDAHGDQPYQEQLPQACRALRRGGGDARSRIGIAASG